jgi:hypothetical protein
MKIIIKNSMRYKGHTIENIEDNFAQKFALVDNEKLFASASDAKRYINGIPQKYQILPVCKPTFEIVTNF